MKIYDLLRKDHDKVKGLLNSLEKKFDPKLFEQLNKEVIAHSEAEEEAFYDPLKAKVGKLKILIKTGHDEHDLTMDMLKQVEKVQDNEEERTTLLSVIKKSLLAHIEMEEEDLFKLAEKHFTAKEAQEMSAKMKELKAEFEEKL